MPLDWKPGRPRRPKRDWPLTLVIGFIVVAAAVIVGSLLGQSFPR